MKHGIVVLSGGVGGAKLVLGLDRADAGPVTAIGNTGDDFEHMGLYISPDIDTLLYTLSGKSNLTQGWGRADETWNFMTAVVSLGAPDWFNLGDGDLALHVLRSAAMRKGEALSAITARFATRWGIGTRILPMTDDRVATVVETDEGLLPFQNYFVQRRCDPVVRGVAFEGAETAQPAPGVLEAIADARAILIAPSNPFLSIAPILAIPAIAEALRHTQAPVVAVSPLVGGKAVKGPTDKIMTELGMPTDAGTIMARYDGIIDGIVVDENDPADDLGIAVGRTQTLMITLDDRIRVARSALALADRL